MFIYMLCICTSTMLLLVYARFDVLILARSLIRSLWIVECWAVESSDLRTLLWRITF